MRKTIGWVVAMILGLSVVAGCGKSEAAESSKAPPESRAVRGKYLVSVLGCNDCHTPLKMGSKGPERDYTRLLSGHPEQLQVGKAPEVPAPWMMTMVSTGTAFAGPWGTTFAMNLTPDVNTGIGLWTEEMFMRAIRDGRHWGQSRPIMPPMPWDVYRNLTDEDLKSVYAFLRTIPPVVNHVPEYRPPPEKDGE
jgi:hypothetical protein